MSSRSADLSFVSKRTPSRPLHGGRDGRRANEAIDDGGTATSRILGMGARRRAGGGRRRAGLASGVRRTVGPAGPLHRRHGSQDGGATRRLALKAPRRRCPASFPASPSTSTQRSAACPARRSGPARNLAFRSSRCIAAFVYTTPIAINIVENGMSQRVIYDPSDFDFGKLQPPAAIGRPWLFRLADPQRFRRGLPRRRDLPGRELLSARAPAGRISASRRADWRSAPATTPARNFRCSASSGSRSRPRPPIR